MIIVWIRSMVMVHLWKSTSTANILHWK